MQGPAKPRGRGTAAIFGKNHDLSVVMPQRLGNSGEPGSAALSDVPSEQPHRPDLIPSRGSSRAYTDINGATQAATAILRAAEPSMPGATSCCIAGFANGHFLHDPADANPIRNGSVGWKAPFVLPTLSGRGVPRALLPQQPKLLITRPSGTLIP
jgi:hypothetical protein